MKAKFILAALMVAAVMTSCSDGGKKQLFNGKDLTGWVCVLDANSNVPTSEVYGVKDGNIHIVGQPFGYMRTAEKYGNYKMHVEWRWIGEGTNSGIFHRVQDGDKVLVTVVTDGYENASREYSGNAIKTLVEELKSKGWVFAYIGANQDVEAVAAKISITNVMQFVTTSEGTMNMSRKVNLSRERMFDSIADCCFCADEANHNFFDED